MKKFILVILFLGFSSCSHSVLVKECKAVNDSDQYSCKVMKPWE